MRRKVGEGIGNAVDVAGQLDAGDEKSSDISEATSVSSSNLDLEQIRKDMFNFNIEDIELENSQDVVIDIPLSDEQIKFHQAESNRETEHVKRIKDHLSRLIVRKAGITSKRQTTLVWLRRAMLATNGYPFYDDKDKYSMAWVYLQLLGTTILAVLMENYASSIKQGCKKLEKTHTKLDEYLKEAYKNGFIKTEIVEEKPKFVIGEEFSTIIKIICLTWRGVERSKGCTINAFNDFRLTEISIHMMSAMLHILTTYKRVNNSDIIVLDNDFVRDVATSFSTAITKKLYRSTAAILKGQNPIDHFSFTEPALTKDDFVLLGLNLLQQRSGGISVINSGESKPVDLNPRHHLGAKNTQYLVHTTQNASANIHSKTILGRHILTGFSSVQNDPILTLMSKTVRDNEGVNGTKYQLLCNIFQNGSTLLPIAMSNYLKATYESTSSWLWIVCGAVTYLFNRLLDSKIKEKASVKASYDKFLEMLCKLGEKRFITFHPDGNADTSKAFEYIKYITSTSIAQALECADGTTIKLSEKDIGYISTRIFYYTASEMLKLSDPNFEIPKENLQRTINAIAGLIKDKLTIYSFTSLFSCGRSLGSVDKDFLDEKFISAINTTLGITDINRSAEQDGTKTRVRRRVRVTGGSKTIATGSTDDPDTLFHSFS